MLDSYGKRIDSMVVTNTLDIYSFEKKVDSSTEEIDVEVIDNHMHAYYSQPE